MHTEFLNVSLNLINNVINLQQTKREGICARNEGREEKENFTDEISFEIYISNADRS